MLSSCRPGSPALPRSVSDYDLNISRLSDSGSARFGTD